MGINVFKVESTNKAIVSSMFFSLIGKALNFVQMMVITYAFGVQASTDILFYVLSTILLLTFFVTSVNNQVIIPEAIRLRNEVSEEEAAKFISNIYYIFLGIGIIGTIILFISPIELLSTFSKFKASDIRDNFSILIYIIPTFLFTMINNFCLNIFNVYKFFTLPMVLDMFKNVVIIIFVLIFKESLQVTSLAMGTLIGNMIQFIIVTIFLSKVLNCKLVFKCYKFKSLIIKNAIYTVLGQLVTFISGFVMLYLLSGFNAGVFSAMDYSQKIVNVMNYVLISQFSAVLGVNFMELYNRKNYLKINEIFSKYLKAGLLVIIPFCFLIYLNSERIISLLFQRGRFDYNAVLITSGFLKYLVLMIPVMLINNFIFKLIYAKQMQKKAFIYMLLYNIFSLTIVYTFIKVVGYFGYAIGLLISYVFYTICVFYFETRKELSFINYKDISKYTLINILLNLAICFVISFVFSSLNFKIDLLSNITYVVLSVVVYLLIFLSICVVSGVNKSVIVELKNYIKAKLGSHKEIVKVNQEI